MGRHGTKVAFALHAQPSRVRLLTLLEKNDPNKKKHVRKKIKEILTR